MQVHCVCFLLLPFGLTLETPSHGADDHVKVTVVAILASEHDKSIDPKLECLAKEIQKTEPRLTGFRLGRTTCKSLPVGESYVFPLIDEKVVLVSVEHGADKDNRVSLKVKPPQLGEIHYSTSCGKFFPI